MSWNMPEGISENDIPENEELAPNQIEEVEFFEKASVKYKKVMDALMIEAPTGLDTCELNVILDAIAYNDADLEDYISEPITEYQEEE